MFFSLFLFLIKLSFAKDKSDENFGGNMPRYNSFLGEFEDDVYEISDDLDSEYDNQETESISERYIAQYDQLNTREERYKLIIWALTELAASVDSSATRNEIEYGIGNEIRTVLNSIDVKDREIKTQFENLQTEINQLKDDILLLVNNTRDDLQNSLKMARKEIVRTMRDRYGKLFELDSLQHDVNQQVEKSVKEYKSLTTKKAIIYFVGFQILLFLCVFFYSRYIKEIRLE